MSVLLGILAVVLIGYWLFGVSQPAHNKPAVLAGPAGCAILVLGIVFAVLAFVL